MAENVELRRGTIGVLGGIGPESTGEFYLRLIKQLQRRGLINSNCDYPHIIINSIPAPELIGENVKKSDLMPYLDGLKQLERSGADFIVVVCNTIHSFYDALQSAVSVPVFDLRQAVGNLLLSRGIKTLAFLGLPVAVHEQLYYFSNMRYINLSNSELASIGGAIFDFNRGAITNKQVAELKQIARRCIAEGADVLLLGCTEVALILKDIRLPKVDTIDVLVEGAIQYLTESDNNASA